MHPEQTRRVFSNFGWAAAGEVVGRLIGLAIVISLARALGASLFGAIGVTLALMSVFEILVRAGTGQVGIRAIALAPSTVPAMHARITGLRLVVAAVSIAFLWLAAPALASWLSVPVDLIRLYSVILLANALTVAWALRGLERMDILAVGTTLQRLMILGGVLLLVHDGGNDLLRVPVIESAAALLVVGWYRYRVAREHGPLPFRFVPREWLAMSSQILPLTMHALLGLVFVHAGILLLGWFSGTEDAGRFFAAHKIFLTCVVLAALLNRAALPATSRLMDGMPARALSLHAALVRYLMLLFVPVVVAGSFFAADLMALLFGGAFPAAAPVLELLLLALPVIALVESLRHLLLAHGSASYLMWATGLSAGAHILLALVFIPRWDVTGAALALLLGEASGLCLLLVLTRRVCGGLPLQWLLVVPFVAGAVMAAVLVAGASWDTLPRLTAGSVAYLATAAVFRAVSLAECRAALRLIGSGKTGGDDGPGDGRADP